MADKVIYAMYDDDDTTKDAAQHFVDKGVHVSEVYSPFPIHGIDPIIGVEQSRLGIVAFMFGLTGLAVAMIGIRYMNIIDWPMNIGGKPNFDFFHNMPSFVPVMFEFTVLIAAHGMAFTYLLRNKTLPGMPARNPDPRTTDDRFVIELRLEDNHNFSVDDLLSMAKQTNIVELEEKTIK